MADALENSEISHAYHTFPTTKARKRISNLVKLNNSNANMSEAFLWFAAGTAHIKKAPHDRTARLS